VVGTGRVTWGRSDAAVFFRNEIIVAEGLIRRETPELAAHAFVHVFGKGLGEAVSECLQQDRGIVVVVSLEARQMFFDADAGGDCEAADPVRFVELFRCDEIGQAEIGAFDGLVDLLTQAVQGGEQFPLAMWEMVLR